MKKILYIALITVLHISCQNKKTIEQPQTADADSLVTMLEVPEEIDSTKVQEAFDTSNCIRGQAQPILKKDKYPNSTFVINKDGLTGTETTELSDGDRLIISNGGCEYYVLTFRFETSRFEADTTDLNFWSSRIVELMNGVTDGIDAPTDIKKATSILRRHIEAEQIQLYDEITFEPGEIRGYITIDRIQKVDNKRYGLEISYIVGPL